MPTSQGCHKDYLTFLKSSEEEIVPIVWSPIESGKISHEFCTTTHLWQMQYQQIFLFFFFSTPAKPHRSSFTLGNVLVRNAFCFAR